MISIHALREEGDKQIQREQTQDEQFLSTPSARRATGHGVTAVRNFLDFYPRPPRGGRPQGACGWHRKSSISIHALREEGDTCSVMVSLSFSLFLSTPSARRATEDLIEPEAGEKISIHALREEGDQVVGYAVEGDDNFYPRPPRGGRLLTYPPLVSNEKYFYPRPPRGGRL